MKHIKIASNRGRFDILTTTREAQAAIMTLPPGGASDDEPSNEHPRCEQCLLVLAGVGEAMIGRRRGALGRVKLAGGSLLVIEKGELHQIKNTGSRPLRTINFYIPPAYDPNGEPRPSATRGVRAKDNP